MTDLSSGPYRGLASFGDSPLDALLFFGREREREAIVANVLAGRLTVLYGPSGVGKSSLLRAGVAQQLRTLGGAVVVHDAWVDDPVGALAESVRTACPGLGPTAGLVDTVAAAAQAAGEVRLLLDQFEEYFLYHGAGDPLGEALPELLGRRGARVSVLLALRDDALSELDAFAGRTPYVFENLLRLDRLDRSSARLAIVGPLERYGELTEGDYSADPDLVEAVLDEVREGRVDFSGVPEGPPSSEHVEAPFLQLVLERLWADEQVSGSSVLRLETLRRLGGAETIVREHVQGALGRLTAPEKDVAARIVRQLVTPSGTKISHTAADLGEYAGVEAPPLRAVLATLVRDRILRVVDGSAGGPPRYEIFHDVLAAPLLVWRTGHELEQERVAARRQRRRLLALVGAALVALAIVAGIAAFALTQRSSARAAERRAHGRELAAQALAAIPVDPAASVASSLRAVDLAPGRQTEDVLRSSLLALRERRVIRVGGGAVSAAFLPGGLRTLVASSSGIVQLYNGRGDRLVAQARQGPVTRIAWSDDSLFAIGDATGRATIRRAVDGRVVSTVLTGAPITALSFARRELAVGSGSRVRILRSPGAPLRTIRVNGAVVTAALDGQGKLLAVAVRRGGQITTEILDAGSGRVLATLPERGIGSLTFSPDGTRLATGSSDGTARLWMPETGRLLHVLAHRGHVLAERFSPDGGELVTASADGTAGVWDVRTGERRLLLVGATGAAEDAAFGGRDVIAVAFADGVARLYSAQDGRLLAPLAGHTAPVTSVNFDPTGRILITAADDGTARLWDAVPVGELVPIDRRAGQVRALFAGRRVWTFAGRSARLLGEDGEPLRAIETREPIVAVAAHGYSVAVVDAAGTLTLDSISARPTEVRRLGVAAVAYQSDGKLLAGSRDGRIWTVGADLRPQLLARASGPVASLSPGAGRFAVRTTAGAVEIFTHDGRAVARLPARVQVATLSPDGATVVTAAAREADVWSAATGVLLHRLTGHRSLVTDAEFSPDGERIVTASDDHDARTWDTRTGRLLRVLRGHFFPVRTASFSPDGRWVVTASQFTAGLWNANTGRLLLYLRGHTRPLTGAAFSPDGQLIATGSYDGSARIFQCDICRDLSGLEQVARARLRSIGRQASP